VLYIVSINVFIKLKVNIFIDLPNPKRLMIHIKPLENKSLNKKKRNRKTTEENHMEPNDENNEDVEILEMFENKGKNEIYENYLLL